MLSNQERNLVNVIKQIMVIQNCKPTVKSIAAASEYAYEYVSRIMVEARNEGKDLIEIAKEEIIDAAEKWKNEA